MNRKPKCRLVLLEVVADTNFERLNIGPGTWMNFGKIQGRTRKFCLDTGSNWILWWWLILGTRNHAKEYRWKFMTDAMIILCLPIYYVQYLPVYKLLFYITVLPSLQSSLLTLYIFAVAVVFLFLNQIIVFDFWEPDNCLLSW